MTSLWHMLTTFHWPNWSKWEHIRDVNEFLVEDRENTTVRVGEIHSRNCKECGLSQFKTYRSSKGISR